MEPKFWHERWERNEIRFHNETVNPLLVKHSDALGLSPGQRIFVPLCGKTLDIGWLLQQGYRVAGVELSDLAVQQLFTQLATVPTVTTRGTLKHFHIPNLDIFCGDLFTLSPELLGPVNAVYDRAALVALPRPIRDRYTAHITTLTACARQLLISFDYDQSLVDGPPFSVPAEEIRAHYGDRYRITLLEREDVPGGLKGRCPAVESVWSLLPAR
ncbi:MAG: thiopurine S-methyltransferase [Nitrospiraceae bacterium]